MTTLSNTLPVSLPVERASASTGPRLVKRWMYGLVLIDAVALSVAAVAGWQGRLLLNPFFEESLASTAVVPQESFGLVVLWLVVLLVQGGYSFRRMEAGADLYRVLGSSALVASGCAGIAMYLTETDFTRSYFVAFYVLGLFLLTLERYALRRYLFAVRRKGRWGHRVVAIGEADPIADAVTAFDREKHLGYSVVGAVSRHESSGQSYSVPMLGAFTDIAEVCAANGADTVLIAGGSCSAADLKEVGWALHGQEIDIIVLPSLLDIAGPRVHFRVDGGLPRVHVTEPQASRAVSIGKRLFDVLVSSIVLLFLAIPMAMVAIGIKAGDGGPIFFRQRRIGINGEEFGCWKFRSMRVDADALEEGLRALSGHDGALWKMTRDPRVTRLGAFIRRYSMDELPQLFNVLRGDMSLVGPRPQQQWEVDTYSAAQRRRLLVKPGMTGLWQVSGRSTLSLEEAVRLDLYYVENWTMIVDLVIMLRTVRAVVGSRGAY
ncbi:MAG: sugar transferase [Ornithinimicrobium sp.]